MTAPRIRIVSMRTWGELGNLLAGHTLAAHLRAGLPGAVVDVVEGEELYPPFAGVGAAIRDLVRAGLPPDGVRAGYLRIMDGLTRTLPPDFEAEPPPALRRDLGAVAAHLDRDRPDLVIGTKGVLSRLCHAALHRSGRGTPVVNYVTNEGLLRLPVHRSRTLPVHLVQFERARAYLVGWHGYDPGRVHAVGRLLARDQAGRFFEGGAPAAAVDPALAAAGRRVLVLANRGGPAYGRLVAELAADHPDAALVVVALHDPDLAAAAAGALCGRPGPWRVFEALPQGDFLRYLDWLAAADAPLFLSKTGPNAMLEGLHYGLPQLLLRSGLPMEEWVGPFLAEHGVGAAFDRMADLAAAATRWVGDPAGLGRRRDRARRLSATLLDPAAAHRRTVAAVAAVLAAEGVPCAPE
ncbi:hypothetical protein GCM10010123_40610 [Pilimelia anulata]|uniref:Uncharacterized protein n=1 Tax=Pilimelia anulata TaxID=53371 RepID=A0A8J3BDV2_9ACTN|nr:hypothetical protein [Pilimelia anulata]GGK06719.1 hypothetical protein GCM10010123_40610 [Pilimelia anulata]